jgi:acetyltransferase-like isoleucine patch superfamily enzyme
MSDVPREYPFGGRFYGSEELRTMGFKRVGEHVQIHSRASVYCPENIELGDHVRIDDYAVIIASGPLRIGSHVSIPNFCFIGSRAGITFEDFSTLAPGVRIFSASDDYLGHHLTNVTVPRDMTGGISAPVTVGRHAIVGANSVILPGLTIGEGCAVGACSLVKTDLAPWGVYAGVPVRRVKERAKDLLKLEARLRC